MINRRHFSLALASAPWAASFATPLAFREGVEYQKLKRPVALSASQGITIVHEFFSYSCIHCYRLNASFEAWAKKLPANKFRVEPVHVRFNAMFEPLQRTFYTLEALQLLKKMHTSLFYALHVEQQSLSLKNASDFKAITRWLVDKGVNEKQFVETAYSLPVTQKMTQANRLTDEYAIDGTPAIGIAGKYLIPGQGEKTLSIAQALLGLPV